MEYVMPSSTENTLKYSIAVDNKNNAKNIFEDEVLFGTILVLSSIVLVSGCETATLSSAFFDDYSK